MEKNKLLGRINEIVVKVIFILKLRLYLIILENFKRIENYKEDI